MRAELMRRCLNELMNSEFSQMNELRSSECGPESWVRCPTYEDKVNITIITMI